MALVLAPMEGLLDFVLRDVLTRVGGIDRCVSEFIRITNTLLPERVFLRVVPELAHGGRTPAGVPVRPQLLGSDPACLADNAARVAGTVGTTFHQVIRRSKNLPRRPRVQPDLRLMSELRRCFSAIATADIDALDQKLDDPGLLGRKQFIPERIEPRQNITNPVLG